MTGSVGYESPEQQFGARVRAAREERGWSQETLASQLAAAHISVGGQSGVARIEKGTRPTRLNEVVDIARFLEIDLALISSSRIRITTEDEVREAIDEIATIEAHKLQLRGIREPLVDEIRILDDQWDRMARRRAMLREALDEFYVLRGGIDALHDLEATLRAIAAEKEKKVRAMLTDPDVDGAMQRLKAYADGLR